mgnify:CR=1 FL=1
MCEFPCCPYCGDKMELQVVMSEGGSGYTAWYQCVVCDSTSPFIELPENSTRVQIEKKALVAALYRTVPENAASDMPKRTENKECSPFTLLPSGIILNISRIDGIIRSEAKDSPYAVFVGGSDEAFRIDCDDYKALLPELHLPPKEDDFNGNQDEN